MNIKQKVKRNSVIIFPALFLAMTFCLFGPLQLYLTNITEFWFSINDIWWICVIAGITVFLFSVGIGILLPHKYLELFSCAIWGLALGLYIQGNFVTINYGTLNGQSVNWDSYSFVSVWDTLLWIFCLIAPFIIYYFRKNAWKNLLIYLSTGIIAVQIITLGVLFFATDFISAAEERECTLTKKGEFELSSQDNTIVFILDCYDSKVFPDFLSHHPEYKETLWSDFTYYPNTVAGAARTVMALPFILTGQPYDYEAPYSDYLERSYSKALLYNLLCERDYSIGLYTDGRYVSDVVEKNIINLSSGKKHISSYMKLTKCLYQFTACRYFPHVLKKSVWMYSGDFNSAAETYSAGDDSPYVSNDAAFFKEITENKLSINEPKNAFRLYHLDGLHVPYTLDSNGQRATETSQEEQNLGLMMILGEYFSQMKALGIYDSANIIVMSDHGEAGHEYNPLFLVKRGNDNSDFKISEIPVSYANLHATILDMTGGNTTSEKSLFDLTEQDNEERFFYIDEGTANEVYSVEYIIRGNVSVVPAKETGKRVRIFSDSRDKKGYSFGQVLFFDNTKRTAVKYMVDGFTFDGLDFTWTNGYTSVLRFPLEKRPLGDVAVSLNCTSRLLSTQYVGVTINSELLNYYQVDSDTLRFIVPKHMITSKSLEIQFDFPNAVSPQEVFGSSDNRILALGLYSIELCDLADEEQSRNFEESTVPVSSANQIIDFSALGNFNTYSTYGWNGQENNGIWTTEKSMLSICLNKNKSTDVIARIEYEYLRPDISTDFYLNDVYICTLDSETPKTVVLHKEYLNQYVQKLSFVTQGAVSPKSTGISDDSRTLGMFISKIVLSER